MDIIRKSEEEHLEGILVKVNKRLSELEDALNERSTDVREAKKELWDSIYELDPVEIMNTRSAIESSVMMGDEQIRQQHILRQMAENPYFARIDFKYDDEEDDEKKPIGVYIGRSVFMEEGSITILIFDWRSPIAGMFYDFEVGKAFYDAPAGRITGDIVMKRQYKIKNGKLEYFFESDVSVNDEILQRCLAESTSGKMHNIVATIQREQNAIIRNITDSVVILQGAAGSGKTSIALHRAAYLMYKYKDSIRYNNIMIVSPNNVFASYISSVLPELGEQNILECEMGEIIEKMIPEGYELETQFEHLRRSSDEEYQNRTLRKSTLQFVKDIEAFAERKREEIFVPIDLTYQKYSVSKEFLKKSYASNKRRNPFDRIEAMANDVEYNCAKGIRISRATLKRDLFKMFEYTDAVELYREFCDSEDNEYELCMHNKKIEYADAFAIAYIKMLVEGFERNDIIKHIIIDEMQDYPPICYAIIAKLYKCNKTFLGDISQTLGGFCSTSAKEIAFFFPNARVEELLKSYRSTFEIMNLARKILPTSQAIPMERHGAEPVIKETQDLISDLREEIKAFRKTKHKSMAIICKSDEQAKKLYTRFDKRSRIKLLTQNDMYGDGIFVTSVQVAKGLEFDEVMIPFCDDDTYFSDTDRNLLYVAATRALHKLDLFYEGTRTKLI